MKWKAKTQDNAPTPSHAEVDERLRALEARFETMLELESETLLLGEEHSDEGGCMVDTPTVRLLEARRKHHDA